MATKSDNRSVAQARITVTPVDQNYATGCSVTAYNADTTNTILFGDGGLTVSSGGQPGIPLYPGEKGSWDLQVGDAICFISDTGTNALRLFFTGV